VYCETLNQSLSADDAQFAEGSLDRCGIAEQAPRRGATGVDEVHALITAQVVAGVGTAMQTLVETEGMESTVDYRRC
jgi:hypothetical protein